MNLACTARLQSLGGSLESGNKFTQHDAARRKTVAIMSTFQGRLGRDPEIKFLDSGAVCNFSVAVDGRGKDAPPTWVRVAVWGKSGETVAEHFEKGKGIFISGELSVREYHTKDGDPRYSVECNANHWEFVSSSKGDDGPPRESDESSTPRPSRTSRSNG